MLRRKLQRERIKGRSSFGRRTPTFNFIELRNEIRDLHASQAINSQSEFDEESFLKEIFNLDLNANQKSHLQ